MKYLIISILFIFFINSFFSCDAVNHLHYMVENKTDQPVLIHVPRYEIQEGKGAFNSKKDTILVLKPKEKIWIAASLMDIDFPWATKKIYREHPGICGLELIEKDSVIPLNCDQSSWKYSSRHATFIIK